MSSARQSTITRVLQDGELRAPERIRQILPIVYDELRDMARLRMADERQGHLLAATALVHEAYLRLLGSERGWRDRGHFFAAAAEAMRRILVDHARKRDALKRGGDRRRLDIEGLDLMVSTAQPEGSMDLEALDLALKALEQESERKATLVKLRYFAGLTLEDAAAALDVSPATADRDWAYAKAFLLHEISKTASS